MSNMGTSTNDGENKNELPKEPKNQIQKQINKQKVLLKQDQNSSNTLMCRVLSELENLVIFLGYKDKKLFDYYASNQNKIEGIINQILLQMTIFESSYQNFIKKNPNKEYDYPNNLGHHDIINIVKKWKAFIPKKHEQYKSYYDEFLNILKNKNLSEEFNKKFEDLDKNSKKLTKSELRKVMNAGSSAIGITNEKNKEIEKEISEKGDYKVEVVIGGNRKDNQFYKMADKDEKNFQELKDQLNKYLNSTLGYLQIYALLKVKSNKETNTKIKYIHNIKDKQFEDYIKSQYDLNLENYCKINKKIFNDHSYNLEEKEKNEIKQVLDELKLKVEKDDQKIFDEAINCIYNDKEPIK